MHATSTTPAGYPAYPWVERPATRSVHTDWRPRAVQRTLAPGKTLRGALAILAIASASGTASGQYLNRAVWLGVEEEWFRRDYRQGDDYFVNRAAYVDVPPWWRGKPADPFGNVLDFAGGSVSTNQLTLELESNVGVQLGSGFTGRLHFLQSEHQTTQFERVAFGLDAALSEQTALFMQLEGTPNKSRADLSLGAELSLAGHSRHRFMLTLVDFAWRKGEEFEYDRAPYALGFAGIAGDPARFELYYELGLQLPFTEVHPGRHETFEMERGIGLVEARVSLSARDRLILGLDGELTRKELREVGAGASSLREGEVDHHRLRAEWWRSFEAGHELALGLSWRRLREDDDLVSVERAEALLHARGRLPVSDKWSAEPYVIGGSVQFEEDLGAGAGREEDDGFQGRLGVPFAFSFSDRARIRFDLSFDLDDAQFGGAGVQVLVTF